MKRLILILIYTILLSACSSAAANTQAEATLERQRQLTAQTEADAQRQADMMSMLQQQALANQQAQAAAANAQAQASAALAQAGQAQAAALNAVATVAGDGVRLPTSVALALLGAIVAIVLGIVYAITSAFNRSSAAYEPPPAQVVRLLPNPTDPTFNRLLSAKGGYWHNGRAYRPDGVPITALLAAQDILMEDTPEWTR